MFKIGILGCGKIAQVRHIPEYAANPEAQLAGFFDLNQARAQEIAAKYGARTYATAEELLADPEIDAVSVCTANNAHASLSIAALKAGKHVLCEKPMAATMEECEAMAAAARESGKFLMIAQNQRLAPAHRKAKELLDAGVIGRIITFRTSFGHGGPEKWSVDSGNGTWFFDKKLAAMGAMADLGIHKTDLIQYLTGEKVTRVTARLDTLDKKNSAGEPIGVEDNAICVYDLTGGIMGTMTASWTYYGPMDDSTVLYGSKGILRLYDDPCHALIAELGNGEKIVIDPADNPNGSGVIDEWMECLKENRQPSISGESVLTAMRAVFAAIRSSEEGRSIEL